jgi:LuxR family quorum-sensing system transcriptional regulator SolR
LSIREREVLQWVKEGKTNGEIARILSISERTVKFHVQNTLAKLHASNRGHAVVRALASGLIRHTEDPVRTDR